MLIKERVIGVLEGINKRGGIFSEQDESILSVTASHAATAIHNARLFRDAERRAHYLEAVRDELSHDRVVNRREHSSDINLGEMVNRHVIPLGLDTYCYL